MPALWDTSREVGPAAEQGALEQPLRGRRATSLRECGGPPGGATEGSGSEHRTSHRSALPGTMGRKTAPATATTDGGGRNLPGQEGQVPHGGVQSGDRRAAVVWQGAETADAG